MRVAHHVSGNPWRAVEEVEVKRVRPPSVDAINDGSPDAVVSVLADDTKVVFIPESLEDINGMIRAFGELKSRWLNEKDKPRGTVFE